jgi:glycosyltransferase involved in cell wall biosynthesis
VRIALSTSVIQRGRSGVGQYVLALVRALIPFAAGNEFTLLVLEQDVPLFSFAAGSMDIVPVPERFRPAVRDIYWHQAVLPRLARKRGLDVLHVPSYRRMLWPRPCALVSTIHDLAPFHLKGKYDLARMFYGRVVARRLSHRQDEIITVSRTTASDVETYFGIPANRLTVIPNGVDHARFRPGSQAEARAAVCEPVGIQGPFFLYVARLEHPGKNHSRLIHAFSRFKASTGSPWKMVFAGGDWHGAEVIRGLVRESPYRDDIRILGFVPSEDLPNWYRAADVFVFPSLSEGFGMPPVEAMACGCPVLSSVDGALAETVGTAAGPLEVANVGQIEAQLTRAASYAGWRDELRGDGLVHAERFDWSKAAAATMGVYWRAASGGASSDLGSAAVGSAPPSTQGINPLVSPGQTG